MVILLYGSDDYRRGQKRGSVTDEFKKKNSDLGVEGFDLSEENSFESLRIFLRNQSIFEKKKLVILENAFEEDVRDKLAGILKPLVGEKNVTVLLSERKSPVKILNFLLEPPVVSQEFEYLSGVDWEVFIRSEAKRSGFTLDDSAVRFLAEVYKGNTWGLVTELDKLSNFKQGAITKKDLEGLDLEVAPNYWAILNSLKSREIRNRLWALEKMLAMGDPPPKIFNILASQWKEKIPAMAEYDLKIKSGKLDYEEAILDLVISN